MKHASLAILRRGWIGLPPRESFRSSDLSVLVRARLPWRAATVAEDDANQAPKAHYFSNVLTSRRGDRFTSQ